MFSRSWTAPTGADDHIASPTSPLTIDLSLKWHKRRVQSSKIRIRFHLEINLIVILELNLASSLKKSKNQKKKEKWKHTYDPSY
jgi:hypothetical protein